MFISSLCSCCFALCVGGKCVGIIKLVNKSFSLTDLYSFCIKKSDIWEDILEYLTYYNYLKLNMSIVNTQLFISSAFIETQ